MFITQRVNTCLLTEKEMDLRTLGQESGFGVSFKGIRRDDDEESEIDEEEVNLSCQFRK